MNWAETSWTYSTMLFKDENKSLARQGEEGVMAQEISSKKSYINFFSFVMKMQDIIPHKIYLIHIDINDVSFCTENSFYIG